MTPKQIIDGMAVWYEGRHADSPTDRNIAQRAWDSAILTASEYVRRRQNYDETLALELHEFLSAKLPK